MERAVLQTPLDRYIILEYLAEGGMGAIYLGKKLGMGGFEKEVVLKQLLPEFTEQPEFIDLFLREARLSASLDHANIVHTIDLVAAGSDFFIVMEYVRGGDLRTLVKRARRRSCPWRPEAALFIGREVLGALAYAHAKTGPDGKPLNLIHRDVSPSNILLSSSGEVKLTDFGIAKANTHRSVFYRVKGKVGYMSPEQARGETLDHRSDLYSCAVCLYEMLSGERLFIGDLSMSAEQIYSQPVPPLSARRREVPGDIDQVMAKALSVDPDQRYQTAVEFSDALLRVAHRNQLMFSSPELAAHLREICGDEVTTWMRVDTVEPEATRGTELYDAEAEGDEEEDDEVGPVRASRRPPSGEFAGRELTSVIDSHTFVPRGASLSGLFTSVSGSGPGTLPPALAVAPELSPSLGDPTLEDDPHVVTTKLDESTRHYSPPPSRRPGVELQPGVPQPVRSMAASASRPAATAPASHRHTTTAPPRLAGVPAVPAPVPAGVSRGTRRRERRRATAGLLLIAAIGAGVAAAVGLTRPDLTLVAEEALRPRLATREPAAAASAPMGAPPPAQPAPSLAPAAPSGPPTAEPVAPAMHEARGRAPAGRGVTLEVASLPPAGSVLLDGKQVCMTPCRVRDLLREPLYQLKVQRSGYVSWSSLVDLRGRSGDRLTALLRPEPDAAEVGWLAVRSSKPAEIYLNGKEIGGVANDGKIPVKPGRYDLQLVNPRSTAKPSTEITVARGATVNVSLPVK
jgi:serine/threonine protein kinase